MTKSTTGVEEFRELFRAMGREMGAALGESLVESVRAQLPRLREELGLSAGPVSVPGPSRRPSLTRGAKVSASLIRPCPVPGCDRPGRGPRFSFLCDLHRDLPASDREQYRIRPRRQG